MMRGAKSEAVERYIQEEEARSGPIFVLDRGAGDLLCYLNGADELMAIIHEDGALYVGAIKHLRKLGRVYSDEASAVAARQRGELARRG